MLAFRLPSFTCEIARPVCRAFRCWSKSESPSWRVAIWPNSTGCSDDLDDLPDQKITFGEMRHSSVRDVLVYCRDHRGSHHLTTGADRWADISGGRIPVGVVVRTGV
jgi:hypothetical protein